MNFLKRKSCVSTESGFNKNMKKITAFFLLILFLSASFNISVLAQNSQEVLIKNATVMTAANGTLQNTDVLIRGGR